MSEEQMIDTTNVGTVEEVVTTEAPKKEKVVNNVTMEDGSVIDFGSRSTLIVTPDLEENSITFNLSNGKIISWKPAEVQDSEGNSVFPGLVDLPEVIRKPFLYGLQERVKSVTGPIKEVADIQVAIEKQISAINSGNFYVRSLGGVEEPATLTQLQQAYALAKSVHQPEKFAHWAEYTKPDVIKEVLATWEGFDRKDVGKIRTNAAVQHYINQWKLAAGQVGELI